MNKKITKIGKAVAGSALLVGATLTGAAGLASAADGSQDLGDYPAPFVDDNGAVQSTIVVGESAKTVDVVGAVNIAGSLGNAAFSTETESVSVSGSGGSWSASNGVTLDTRNDDLYFGDSVSSIRETLTEQDLDVLSETTFEDGSGSTTDITQYVNVGDRTVQFGNGPDGLDNEDPVTHVTVPTENNVDSDNYLLNLQANFEDSIDFTDDEDVQGEEIEMFGKTFTVADENADSSGSTELLLYGSSEEAEVSTGEETTVTIDGEEVTFGVESVQSSGSAAVRVDGSLSQEDLGDTMTINGQTVRIDEIVNTGASDDGQGVVVFAIGSEELTLQNGEPVQDDDDDDIEGTRVYFNGDDTNDMSGFSDINDISSVDVYLGSSDDDEDYLAAGDSFSHELFSDAEFHFGGLNPDAAEDGDAVGEVSFDQSGDDDATVSFSVNGESQSINFLHDEGDADANTVLADSDDGDSYVVVEGQEVTEEDYFFADAGDFSHMFEVTGVDVEDSTSGEFDDGTVDLQDTVSGDSMEVDVTETSASDDDGNDDDADEFEGTKIIDGQKYHFHVTGDDNVRVTWGAGAGADDTGDEVSVYSALDTDSGAAVAFTETATLPQADEAGVEENEFSGSNSDSSVSLTSSGDFSVEVNGGQATDGSVEWRVLKDDGSEIASGTGTTSTVSLGSNAQAEEVEVTSADGTVDSIYVDDDGDGTSQTDTQFGPNLVEEVTRDVVLPSTESTDAQTTSISYDQTGSNDATTSVDNRKVGQLTYDIGAAGSTSSGELALDVTSGNPAVAVVQPEDDDDNEEAFVVRQSNYDSDDGYEFSGSSAVDYTGNDASYSPTTLDESDDDMDVQYFEYGTYTSQNTDSPGSFTLNIPYGQSVVGAAVTGADGSLSAEGGTSSGSVETSSPTGWPDSAALDSDSNIDSLKTSNEMILVGGPAVNALTQELADDDKTMAGSEYEEGTAMVQMVNNAFAEGQDALVVSGYAGEDTREAANYVANYADHQEEMAGKQKVELTTQQTQNAE